MIAVTAAALVWATAPPSSAAAGGNPGSSAAFTVRGTNGFSLDVDSQGATVTVAASERRPPIATFSPVGRPLPADTGNGASSIYYARGFGTGPAEVDAPLGTLGRISVRFHPSGRTHVTVLPAAGGPVACGRPVRIARRLGTFTGTIEFKGEGGYTTVEATRAQGSVGTPLPSKCGDRSAARRGGAALSAASQRSDPGSAVLGAVRRADGTSFRASTTDFGVAFLATFEEHLGDGLVVSRRAYAGAPLDTFTFNRALTSSRVRPPAPFSGSARLVAGGGRQAASWTGNLRATFPGLSVPMTGPGFRASLGPGR